MTVVAILQPSYLPWKGYFSQIQHADDFVFLDNVQYDRRGWRNRNRIRTPSGPKWITVPVHASGSHDGLLIQDVEVVDRSWANKHRQMIHNVYSKWPQYRDLSGFADTLFDDLCDLDSISAIGRESVERVAQELGIETRFHLASELLAGVEIESPTQRLVQAARKLDASVYLSGPAAKDYLDVAEFTKHEIAVGWMDYDFPPYPVYTDDESDDFEHAYCIFDLLFSLPTNDVIAHLSHGRMVMDSTDE